MAIKGAVKKDSMVAKSIRNLMCDPKNAIVIVVPITTKNPNSNQRKNMQERQE